MNTIRNFAIIAHVDHGKSTLADRLMEFTHTIEKGSHVDQLLDRNPISRKRGITIKLAPVTMFYKHQHKEYILNLIDTPGHVDFSYEVDRTLSCVEGVILLVDATQGIQAQTIANTYKAIEKNLTIIPVVNKIDLPNAETEKTIQHLSEFLGVDRKEIIAISAKKGTNIHKVVENIIDKIPPPDRGKKDTSVKSLIFDSYYDKHKGVVVFIRIFSGCLHKEQVLYLLSSKKQFKATEIGIFTPKLTASSKINDTTIGYIVTNLKSLREVRVGDTIADSLNASSLPGFQKIQPMVYASLFPTDSNDFPLLHDALEKIYLTDSAITYTQIYSKALGAGFQLGFLGLLHAEVVKDRLENEYNLNLLLTPPHVTYKKHKNTYLEPIAHVTIYTPYRFVGKISRITHDYRAVLLHMNTVFSSQIKKGSQVKMEYEMPLSELVTGFFDILKSITKGYASLHWEFLRYQEVSADKLTICINGTTIEELSDIVVYDKAYKKAQYLTHTLKDIIPRQQFEVRIQALYKGKVIKAARIAPFRKNVLSKGGKKVGGGDYSRKAKLLEKQKRGKKRMKMIGKVHVPKELFFTLFRKSK